jgi:acetoin utilization deacetylase AcuC-like enzyme
VLLLESNLHLAHRPRHELHGGQLRPNLDLPERIEALRDTLIASGLNIRVERAEPCSELELGRVHDAALIEHTREVCASLAPDEEWFPENLARDHALDTYSPLYRETHGCALGAAGCAAAAARAVAGGEGVAYALCRPPGHHADRYRRGGVCYYNNAALAADILGENARVAVLDLDLHFANGTESILEAHPRARCWSIHASTRAAYPFSGGGASPQNLPLSPGTGDEGFLAALDEALGRIATFAPESLVVSVGYDGHRLDPDNDVLDLSEGAYAAAGERVSEFDGPIVLIQEGGYHPETIGVLATSFCTPLDRRGA